MKVKAPFYVNIQTHTRLNRWGFVIRALQGKIYPVTQKWDSQLARYCSR